MDKYSNLNTAESQNNTLVAETPVKKRKRKIKGSSGIYTDESKELLNHIKSESFKYTLLYSLADYLTTLNTSQIAIFSGRGLVERPIATDLDSVISVGEPILEAISDLYKKEGNYLDIINFYVYMLYGGLHCDEDYNKDNNYLTHLSISNSDLYRSLNLDEIFDNTTIYMSVLYASYVSIKERKELFNKETFKEEFVKLTNLLEVFMRLILHNIDLAKTYVKLSGVEVDDLNTWSKKDLLMVNTCLASRLIGLELPKTLSFDVSNYNLNNLTPLEGGTPFYKFVYPIDSVLKHSNISSDLIDFGMIYLELKKLSNSSNHPFTYNVSMDGRITWGNKSITRNESLDKSPAFKSTIGLLNNFSKPYLTNDSNIKKVPEACGTTIAYLTIFETIRQFNYKNKKGFSDAVECNESIKAVVKYNPLAENLPIGVTFKDVLEKTKKYKINITGRTSETLTEKVLVGRGHDEDFEKVDKQIIKLAKSNTTERQNHGLSEKSKYTEDYYLSKQINILQSNVRLSSEINADRTNESINELVSIESNNSTNNRVTIGREFELNRPKLKIISLFGSTSDMQESLKEYYSNINTSKKYSCEGVKTYLDVSKVLYEFR